MYTRVRARERRGKEMGEMSPPIREKGGRRNRKKEGEAQKWEHSVSRRNIPSQNLLKMKKLLALSWPPIDSGINFARVRHICAIDFAKVRIPFDTSKSLAKNLRIFSSRFRKGRESLFHLRKISFLPKKPQKGAGYFGRCEAPEGVALIGGCPF